MAHDFPSVLDWDTDDGVRNKHDVVGTVHCVHDEVGHREIDRYTDNDEGFRPVVPQQRIKMRSGQRAQTVKSGQDVVVRFEEIGNRLHRIGDRTILNAPPTRRREDPGIAVRTKPVGEALCSAVDDGHAHRTSRSGDGVRGWQDTCLANRIRQSRQ